MTDKARASFFYSINERQEGCTVNLLISPGHYGRGLSIVYKNIDKIKAQVEKGKLTYDSSKVTEGSDFVLLEETEEPEMEIGNTDWDKSVMRTLVHAKAKVSKEVLEERLKSADLYAGLPTKF